MTQLINETLETPFDKAFENTFASVYVNKDLQIVICESSTGYIPIEDFKKIFINCSDIIKDNKIKKFIFDKRELRAFHQPSMEWYFIEWKQDLFDWGLKTHRKILPNEDWFKRCVEAGKSEIFKKTDNRVIGLLDIKYTNSVQEAILI